jgi:hypothetical protein
MKTLQSKLFVGVRTLYLLLIIILMGALSFAADTLAPTLVQSVIGLGLAVLIATNYEKGKNWARIWMLIALYLSVILFFKDIADFSTILEYSDFSHLGSFGILVDVVCIAGSVVAIIKVHQAGKIEESDSGPEIKDDTDLNSETEI